MDEIPRLPAQTPPVARPIQVTPDSGTLEYAAKPAADLELTTLSRGQALLDAGLILLTTLVPHYVTGMVLVLAGRDLEIPDDPLVLVVSKWFEALVVSGIAAYLLIRNRLPVNTIGLRIGGLPKQIAWGA